MATTKSMAEYVNTKIMKIVYGSGRKRKTRHIIDLFIYLLSIGADKIVINLLKSFRMDLFISYKHFFLSKYQPVAYS